MAYLLLSTFPAEGTRNSGDDLIGKSLIKLIKEEKGNVDIDVMRAADQEANQVKDFNQYKAVIAPALSPTVKGKKLAPKYRSTYLQEAYRRSIPVFVFGAAGSIYPGTVRQSQSIKLDDKDKETLIKQFNNGKGIISARDIIIEQLLFNNGIDCFGTTGDCALFEHGKLSKKLITPKKIKKIAVSMPHNVNHWSFTYNQALRLKEEFSCEVDITFHGYYGSLKKNIEKDWNTGELNIVDLAGSAEKLSYYDNVDLHVGFRLHAHIWFLRTRKPSLLIAEDGRGLGHLRTIEGLGQSAVPVHLMKKADQLINIDKNLYQKMRKEEPDFDPVALMKKEIKDGYPVTKKSLTNIDILWKNKMQPMLNMLP